MRLIKCRIEKVKRYQEIDIEFAKGITLIGGPNESGKSTLLEAMHRVLFLKANASGTIIESLISKTYPGNPFIKLEFESIGTHWTLCKRFSGQSGVVTLEGKNKQLVSGAEAEEKLAKIIGVNEILGSRQASRILPTRWAHIWVKQGVAANNLIDLGANSYDLKGLINELEKRAETSLQSELDQKVCNNLIQLLGDSFTSKGVKKNSQLYQKRIELENNLKRLEETKEIVRQYEITNDKLEEIIVDLRTKVYEKDVVNTKRRTELEVKLDFAKRNENNLNLINERIKPLLDKKSRLDLLLKKINNLDQEIKSKEQQKRLGVNDFSKLTEEIVNATSEVKMLNIRQLKKEEELEAIETKGNFVKVQTELINSQAELNTLKEDLNKLEIILSKERSLKERLKKLPKITPEDQELISLYKNDLMELEISNKSISSRLSIEKTNQSVLVDGINIDEGKEIRIGPTSTICIGEGIILRLEPFNMEIAKDLKEKEIDIKTKIEQKLKQLKITDLESFDQYIIQLDETNKAYEMLLLESKYSNKIGKSELLEKIEHLRKRITEASSYIKNNFDEAFIKHIGVSNIKLTPEYLINCRNEYKKKNDDLKKSKSMCLEYKKLLSDKVTAEQSTKVKLEILNTQIKERNSQLEYLIDGAGSIDHIEKELKKLNESIKNLLEEKAILSNAIKESGLTNIHSSLNELIAIDKSLQDEIEELKSNKGALIERSTTLSSKDIYAVLEDSEINYENSLRDLKEYDLLTQAQKKLLYLMQNVQLKISNKYTSPIKESISQYLKPLKLGSTELCNLSFSPDEGLKELGLEKEGNKYLFEDLSGGMKEQLNAALRLSIADILKSGYEGCLPIIFDDAFTNTDILRINMVLNMLKKASNNGLQIIILSCDPTPYKQIADKFIKLDK